MSISFNDMPEDVNVPGVYTEFDSSRASSESFAYPKKALLIGQQLSTATVAEATPTRITTAASGETYFGRGSHLAAMITAYRGINTRTELWAIGLDDASGTQGTQTITFTGTSTASGAVYLYVAGRRIVTAIPTGTAAAAIATSVAAQASLETDLPVTFGAATTIVTATATQDGTQGNTPVIAVNAKDGEFLPAGVTVAIAAGVSGATDPDLADAIAAFGDQHYTTLAVSLNDDTNLDLLETELESRWGPTVQQEGHCFVAYAGTLGACTTYCNARNSKHTTCLPVPATTPTTTWEIAAKLAALDDAEPHAARPRRSLKITGMQAPPLADRWTWSERNVLLTDGGSTFVIDRVGDCYVERLVTTHQTNAAGVVDRSYRNRTTMSTLAYLRYNWRNRIELKYPRHLLAEDGDEKAFAPGLAILSPSSLKAEALAWFDAMQTEGYVQDRVTFAAELLTAINGSDTSRVDTRLVTKLLKPLYVVAGQIQFI